MPKKTIASARGFYYFTSILDFCKDGFIEPISASSFGASLQTTVHKIYHGPNVYILKSLSCKDGSTELVDQARTEYNIAKAMSVESFYIAAPIDMRDYHDDDSHEIFIEMLFEHSGESLLDYFKKIKSQDIMEIIRQTLSAFATMHRHQIFHSDIKPANIVIKDGIVKVIDFRVSQELRQKTLLFQTALTSVKGGTKIYLPPEMFVAGSKLIFADIDVYCWGMTIYQLITGKTMDQLETEWESYKNSEKNYEDFLKIIKGIRIEGDTEGFQSKMISEGLLKVLDINPKNRPTFEALLDIFGQPTKQPKSKKIGPDAEELNSSKKLKEVEEILKKTSILQKIQC